MVLGLTIVPYRVMVQNSLYRSSLVFSLRGIVGCCDLNRAEEPKIMDIG